MSGDSKLPTCMRRAPFVIQHLRPGTASIGSEGHHFWKSAREAAKGSARAEYFSLFALSFAIITVKVGEELRVPSASPRYYGLREVQ